MKKLVAIVLSVAMLVSCVPMIAFADPVEQPEKTRGEEFIDNTKVELHDLLIKALGSDDAKAALDEYLLKSEEFQQYKNLVDDFAKAIKDDPENIDVYLEALDEFLKSYIQELQARAAELADDPELQAAIDRLVEELNALDTFLAEHDFDTDKYFPDSLFDIDDKIREAYDDLKDVVDKQFVIDCLNYLVDRAFIIAEEKGADADKLAEIYQSLLDLEAVIEYYASMDKDAAIDALIHDAYEQFIIIADKALNNAVDKIEEYMDAHGISDEQFYELLDKLRDVQNVIDKIGELVEKVRDFDYDSIDLEEIIAKCEAAIKEFVEEHKAEIKDAIDKLIEKAKEEIEEIKNSDDFQKLIDIMDQIKGYIEMIKEIDPDELIDQIVEESKAALQELVQKTLQEIEKIADLTKAELEKMGITEENIQKLIDKAKALQEYVKACIKIYMDMDYGQMIEDLINETQEAIEEFVQASLEKLVDFTKAELEKMGITEENIQKLIDKAKELEECIKDYIEIYKDMDYCQKIEDLINEAEAAVSEALAEAMQILVDEAKEILDKTQIITKEVLQKIFDIMEKIREIVDEYKDLKPDELLQKLIQEARDLFDKYQDKIMEAAMEVATEFLERLDNGDFDKYLELIGMTGPELERLLADLIAYGFGLANGEGYLDLQQKLWDAMLELEELTFEIEELTDDNAALTQALADKVSELEILHEQFTKLEGQYETAQSTITDLQKQVEEAAGDKEIIKKFINGYNVTKKKPNLKKVKAIKKRKVKVTFKGLKGATVQKYKINYKTGKKSKTKTWKKKTTKAKTLKYTLKKLKKGKTYKIRVRATYSFKYNGKKYTFVSKWSKTKKVKVK